MMHRSRARLLGGYAAGLLLATLAALILLLGERLQSGFQRSHEEPVLAGTFRF